MNQTKTFMSLTALTAIFIGIGYLIGGPTGMIVALLVAFDLFRRVGTVRNKRRA